ncbi:MAG: GIY-YIG nuclease family protein [Desulfobacterales bacterium]
MHPFPGTYALLFSASSDRLVQVGRCGRLSLKPGFYVYAGSAFGPGGLTARIAHHRQNSHRPHWHIDYLTPFLCLRQLWYTCDPLQREHAWAEILLKNRRSSVPLEGFGSSDCRCRSHFFFFKALPSGRYFRRKIHSHLQDHGRIVIENVIH